MCPDTSKDALKLQELYQNTTKVAHEYQGCFSKSKGNQVLIVINVLRVEDLLKLH